MNSDICTTSNILPGRFNFTESPNSINNKKLGKLKLNTYLINE